MANIGYNKVLQRAVITAMEIVMESNINLIVNKVTKSFFHNNQQTTVLKDLTQTFEKQRSYALMGPSGTGKSTFLHLLAGLDTPTSGTITCNDQVISALTPPIRAQTIGFVFQSPLLITELTVLENVMLAAQIAGKTTLQSERLAQELLEAVGLVETADWNIGQLSGGQRQRVALARALINKPAFLLADELTGSLDHETSISLVQLLLELQKEWKMGLILSSHNSQIAGMMEFVFLLKDGNLVAMHDGYYPERKHNESRIGQ